MTESTELQQARSYIETHRHERQVNKVLHGFPSPRLWQETAVPVAEMLSQRRQRRSSQPGNLQLYIATPYCLQTAPEKCGYCLFPVEVFTGMSQLEQAGGRWRVLHAHDSGPAGPAANSGIDREDWFLDFD